MVAKKTVELKRLCQNCRYKGGPATSWCTAHEKHVARKDTCEGHNFKKSFGIGR